MADDPAGIALSRADLRHVAGYAAACARLVLPIVERARADASLR